MLNFLKTFIFICIFNGSVFAVEIRTFYGVVNVEEPILLELIESPAFQRLKHIHQYGVAYYTTHREEYTRYEHSLGVFHLLRSKDCSLEEQIAGLLHDASHTVFSHVGDYVFNVQNLETDYQTITHVDYLERSGLGDILRKHGYEIENILPKQELFPALEQPLPTLCADRLDYNLQGAFYQGHLTHEEAVQLFNNIQFIDGSWISNEHDLLKILVRFSISMSQDCWGSGTDSMLSTWLADAMLRGVEIEIITMEDIRFGIDRDVWDILMHCNDPVIQNKMNKILNPHQFHSYVSEEEADTLIIKKFRGINPWIVIDGNKMLLLSIDPLLAEEFQNAKNRIEKGWSIKVY